MASDQNIYFILAVHNHQPVGNLPEVFQKNFEEAYEPFISVLERYPGVSIGLHYSGSLLEWLEENEPGFIRRLRELVERGQVELLGGAYYEPILPVIPEEDKVGQVRYMSSRLQELFGVTPRGMWLAERVWEPHLARPIREAGLEYLALDDAHFLEVGAEELTGYFRTEEGGWPLDVFPISEELRYLIPFKPPGETIVFFKERRDDGKHPLLVLADDGEKFGGWPGTYETVYEGGWLEEFFGLLEENRHWLKVVTFNRYRQMYPPRGPLYLPAASYREMKEWSGGFWRNFLTRYPESNRLHKKMLAVRHRLELLPPGEPRREAQKLIWAGQCNCAYWHGVFGGLYLNFLRAAIWGRLLRAERLIDSRLQPGPFLKVEAVDQNYGGEKEIRIRSDRFTLLLAPHRGGSLWELSWKPVGVNLLDTLTRRPEPYHRELTEEGPDPEPSEEGVVSIHHQKKVKDKKLVEHLHYDGYPRVALVEHFLSAAVGLEEFITGDYREPGDFLMQPAIAGFYPLPGDGGNGDGDGGSPGGRGIKIVFRRSAMLEGRGPLIMEKAITVCAGRDRIDLDYCLHNRGSEPIEYWFGVEFNLAMLGGYDRGRWFEIPGRELAERHPASSGSEEGVEEVSLHDSSRNFGVTLQLGRPARLWRAPVKTISLSEGGLEQAYQQSMLLPCWKIELLPEDRWLVSLKINLFSPVAKGERGQLEEKVGV